MVTARMTINDYTNRVLNVIKAKYNLKDKSEALNKFAQVCGEEFVEREPNKQYLKKILEIDERHMKKYGDKKMTMKELDKLCEI